MNRDRTLPTEGHRQSAGVRLRCVIVVCAIAIAGPALLIASGPASATTKSAPVSAQIIEVQHTYSTGSGNSRCSAVVFLQISGGSQYSSFQGSVYDDYYQATRTFSGPPFDGDNWNGGYGVDYTPPPGDHAWSVSAGSGSAPCADDTVHYHNPQAVGIENVDQIKGQVNDDRGHPASGVTVTATGSGNGQVVSTTTGPGGGYAMTLPDGTYNVVPAHGRDSFSPAKSTQTLSGSDATANFILSPAKLAITGRVVRGLDGLTPSTPELGVEGVKLDVTGTTDDGQAFAATATTDRRGDYVLQAPTGTYTVTMPDACIRGDFGCRHAQDVTLLSADAMVDGVAKLQNLQVTISTDPAKPIEVDQTLKGATPTKVTAVVRVKNVGSSTVKQVRLDSTMIFELTHGSARHFEIPITQLGKPAPQQLGTLKPGQAATGRYRLEVRGDGYYTLSALATGIQQGGLKLAGTGHHDIESRSRLLVFSSEMGRAVHSPEAAALIKGGTSFTVKIKLENRSYAKTLVIDPMRLRLTGNAQDGHVQLADEPIGQLDSLTACMPSEAVVLEPRQTRELEAVIRTTASNPELDSLRAGSGGTRAEIHLPDPTGHVLADDGTLGAHFAQSDVIVAPDSNDFTVHVDDRGYPPQFPRNLLAAVDFLTVGAVDAAANTLVGVVGGLVELPKTVGGWLAQGFVAFPRAYTSMIDLETALWQSLKDDPAARAAFFSVVGNLVLLAYQHAPQLQKQAIDLAAGVNQAVQQHFHRLATEWFAGDWAHAALTFGEGAGTVVTNVALLPGVAECVLPRLNTALTSFKTARAALDANVTTALAELPKAVPALEGLAALKALVKPGFPFDNEQLQKFAGLLEREAQFLRNYAREKGYVIVARTRASESADLIAQGLAVLKPELIKTKTVRQTDIDWLGYSQPEAGLVVLRDPPPADLVVRRLMAHGHHPGDPTYEDVMTRLAERVKEHQELTPALEAIARKGEVTLTYCLECNSMDPSVVNAAPTTYRFRLADGPHGDKIPQFFVKGRWRSVTGDVDFLQVTLADGRPLSDAQRAQVYRDFASSPVGMMHGETATWTYKGEFSFAKKFNEFERSGINIQFGPDGVARGVVFDRALSQFKSPTDYYVHWTGGINVP